MVPQELQREIAAVRDAVCMPVVDIQRHPQICDVCGVFSGVVGAEVVARRGEPVAAGADRLEIGLCGRRREYRHTGRLGDEPVDLRATQQRVGMQRAALVDEYDVTIAVDVQLHSPDPVASPYRRDHRSSRRADRGRDRATALDRRRHKRSRTGVAAVTLRTLMRRESAWMAIDWITQRASPRANLCARDEAG